MAVRGGSVFSSFRDGPFSGGGGGGSQSSSGPGIIPGMDAIYQDTLARNQASYNEMLGSYSSAQNRLAATLPSIYSGYKDVLSQVGNTLGQGGTPYGILAPEVNIENQKSIAQAGNINQQMINRGLGNTTVTGNMLNQNELFRRQATNELGAKLAGMYSGVQERIGLGELGARTQGLGMQTGIDQARAGGAGNFRWQMPGPIVGQYSSSQSDRGPTQGAYNQSGVGGGGAGRSGGGGNKRGADFAVYGGDQPYKPFQTVTGGGGGGYNPFTHTGGQGGSTYGSVNLPAQDQLDYFPPGPFVTPMGGGGFDVEDAYGTSFNTADLDY